MKVPPDGGCVLMPDTYLELRLVDDAEREAFLAYLVAGCRRDGIRDTATREACRNAWFKEDDVR